MTAKIQFRESPLLAPPSRCGGDLDFVLRPSDLTSIYANLKGHRSNFRQDSTDGPSFDCAAFVSHMYELQDLGEDVKFTEEDKAKIRGDWQNHNISWRLEAAYPIYRWLRDNGETPEITDDMKQRLRQQLDATQPTGYAIYAENAHYAKELGVIDDVAPDTLKTLISGLDKLRHDNTPRGTGRYGDSNARHLAHLHYYLKKLGHPQEFTDEDKKKILAEIETLRAEGEGSTTAKMIYCLKQITQKEKPEGEMPEMPPIKKL